MTQRAFDRFLSYESHTKSLLPDDPLSAFEQGSRALSFATRMGLPPLRTVYLRLLIISSLIQTRSSKEEIQQHFDQVNKIIRSKLNHKHQYMISYNRLFGFFQCSFLGDVATSITHYNQAIAGVTDSLSSISPSEEEISMLADLHDEITQTYLLPPLRKPSLQKAATHSQASIDLRSQLSVNTSSTSIIRPTLSLSFCLLSLQKYDKALDQVAIVLPELESNLPLSPFLAVAYLVKAECLLNLGHPAEALTFSYLARDVFADIINNSNGDNWNEKYLYSLILIGWCNLSTTPSKVESALHSFHNVLDFVRDSPYNYHSLFAEALVGISSCFISKAKFNEALEYTFKAEEYSIGSQSIFIALLENQAISHFNLSNFDRAIDCCHSAINNFSPLIKPKTKGRILSLLGSTLQSIGSFAEAQAAYDEACIVFKNENSLLDILALESNKACCLALMGNIDDARELFEIVENKRVTVLGKDSLSALITKRNLAVLTSWSDPEEALKELRKCLKLFERMMCESEASETRSLVFSVSQKIRKRKN
ncbi:hypothetical protein P9112_002351 [Eukaryota sp. TZLM1-RC]